IIIPAEPCYAFTCDVRLARLRGVPGKRAGKSFRARFADKVIVLILYLLSMNKTDFTLVANAVLLYYEHRNSLFADHFIAQELGASSDAIRSKVGEWFHTSPEDLVTHLDPDNIQRVVSKTAAE